MFMKTYPRTHERSGAGKKNLLLPMTPVATVLVLAAFLAGCSSSAHRPVATSSGPQHYMTPVIVGGAGTSATASPATYSIDDKVLTFAQQTYAINNSQTGARINYSGDVVTLSRGLLDLELTYSLCGGAEIGNCTGGVTYQSPLAVSGWAVELAGQAGGLLQMAGQPFTPMVPAVTCPSMSSAETFLFVTLPAGLITSGTGSNAWNPQLETAYGSVDISASGSTVTFANINQNILPSAGGGKTSGVPSSATGACSTTVYGETVAVPTNPTITTDPTGTTTIGPQAMLGIGSSGLLVEDNDSKDANATKGTFYENVLGAGTGAIGLPKPSSALDTTSLVSAQYQGFFYGGGSYDSARKSSFNWSSLPASFGFSSTLQSTCAAVVAEGTSANTSTTLDGGDFANNDPDAAQSKGGFGNCDFAIDLGTRDTSTNGLFPKANVWVGPGFGFTTNTTGNWYSFPAVAIAGQLNGKYAIFLIGEDTVGSPNQAWGIYLLQSN
jgi:hypothetical protein